MRFPDTLPDNNDSLLSGSVSLLMREWKIRPLCPHCNALRAPQPCTIFFLFNYRYGRYNAWACDKTILQNLVVQIFVHCKSPSSILPLVKDKGKLIRNAQVATSAKICPFVACNSLPNIKDSLLLRTKTALNQPRFLETSG